LADDLPIYQHVEAFERALNLYRGQQFEQAAELVSACSHSHQYTIMRAAWFAATPVWQKDSDRLSVMFVHCAQFGEVDRATGGDAPSKLFLARCAEYQKSPPLGVDGRAWDGVYRPTTK
jgi:hypothetical protein